MGNLISFMKVPEDNVRAIASCRNLRELLFQFIRMLNGDFNSGIFLEFLTDFSVSTVVLVALGYMMQRCEEVGCQNHGNAEVAHSESH